MIVSPARALAAALFLVAAPAVAQDSFAGSDQEAELDCAGQSATIEGAGNDITVTGGCQLVTVEGSTNVVHVHMAKGGTIRVTGAANEIYWTTPDGSRLRQQVTGAGNRVTSAPR